MTLKRSGLTEKRTRLTMRTFKGLENIHSVIDKHIAEWRKEQGEPPAEPESISIEERVKRHLIEPEPIKPDLKPRDPNRFINAEVSHEEPTAPHEEAHEEQPDNEPEIISVIKQKEDEHHSWLYNEVLKAIKDAAGDGRNTKVIAVIVPVVQNAKEFENLPVNETITLSPVEEETGEPVIEELISEEPVQEPEPEPAAEEPTPEPEQEPEPEISTTEPEPELEQPEPEENSEVVIEENEEPADTTTEEITEELPEPEEAESVNDIIPEGQDEPDEEEAEAFRQMEESLDESLREKAEELAQVEPDESEDEEAEEDGEIEAVVMPEISEDEEADDLAVEDEELEPAEDGGEGEEEEEISAGEPMSFTEIPFEAVEEEIELQPDPEEKK